MNKRPNRPAPGTNPKKIIGLIVIVLLVIAAAVMAVRVAKLVDLTRVEMSLTPTPQPVYGNVMVVTIDPNAPTPAPVIRHGAQGEDVKNLQSRLKTLGYYDGEVDGQFGGGTRSAVVLFQQQHGLQADGIVGEETRAVLFSAQAHPIVLTPTPAPTATPEVSSAIPGLTADGMPILVNREHHLPDGYRTVDLVNMYEYCDRDVVKIKGSGIEGERIAVDALMDMFRDAIAEGIGNWQVSAGWRSVSYQQKLFDNQVYEYMKNNDMSRKTAESATRKTVADPGSSEHHLGLAFDITVPGVSFKGTKQARWMAENCWEYGFILRYTEEKESITGFIAEPWHFRYVGVEHSLIMRDENLCLEEYLEKYGS
ncbi:MAG: D-alanyl-D-alanine carboxypeptidase family protein [Clostridia bacterium]|nr:D-alanyl-D-alanine carboxypeptidase family protein [Clostridia bacterium]